MTTFAKEACNAEDKFQWLQEAYPNVDCFKTCVKAVKVLPDNIKVVDAIVEHYSNNPTTASRGSFMERVRNSLAGAVSPDNRQVFEVPRLFNASPTNTFALNRAGRFPIPPPAQSHSAYAVQAVARARDETAFYKDLANDLAKLAVENKIKRNKEPKVITINSAGKISLVSFISRSDS